MMTNKNELVRQWLHESNDYYRDLLDLVPSTVYFDSESNQKIVNNIYKKGEDSSSSKFSVKYLKFDPDVPKKTTELQKILPNISDAENVDDQETVRTVNIRKRKNSTSKSSPHPKTKSSKSPNKSENSPIRHINTNSNNADDNNVEDLVTSGMHSDIRNGYTNVKSKNQPDSLCVDSEKSGDASSNESAKNVPQKLNPEELREKLKARIAELQSKRQKGMTPEEFIESKRLRRKASKLKLKQKRKEAKKLKLSVEKQRKNNETKLNGVSEVTHDENKNDSKIVFSKFQFSEQAKKQKEKKQKKPKSYKELYLKVTQDKEKLEKLKKTDSEKAQKVAWAKAMDKSKGVKVKDNPELIKKSMKKEEKLKKQSQKKWQERQDSLAEQQQKRQEKRKKNIMTKKQSKIDRKIKLAKKKGRIVSGF